MLYAAKKLFYLEGLYILWLGGRRYFLTPPQLHASTLASSLDLLPQLFHLPSEIGFQLCCSDELSAAAAAQFRVAVKTATSTTVSFRRLIVVATLLRDLLRSLASTTASHKQQWMLPAEPVAITSSTN